MVKIMIGSIWRRFLPFHGTFVTLCSTASFYKLKNTFGPNAGMQTNEFSAWALASKRVW